MYSNAPVRAKQNKAAFPQTFAALLARAAAAYGTRAAVLPCASSGAKTYRQLYTEYVYLCTALLSMGLKGARIALCGANGYAWLLAFLAAATVGDAVPLDAQRAPAELRGALRRVGARVLVADGARFDVLRGPEDSMVCIRLDSGAMSVRGLVETGRELCEGGCRGFEKAAPDPESGVIVFPSRGEGAEDGVRLSQRAVCENICGAAALFPIRPGQRVVPALRFDTVFGFEIGLLLPLFCGARLSVWSTPREICRHLRKTRADRLILSNEALRRLHRRACVLAGRHLPERSRTRFGAACRRMCAQI